MYEVLMAVQYVGIAILVMSLFFIAFQNTSKIQKDMLFLLASLLITFVAYTLEMQCSSLGEAMVDAKFGYLGKPFIVPSMLILLLAAKGIKVEKGAQPDTGFYPGRAALAADERGGRDGVRAGDA